MKRVEVMQGGMKVSAWVHDCGTVCLARSTTAKPPFPPYLLVEWWCPKCKVVAKKREGE